MYFKSDKRFGLYIVIIVSISLMIGYYFAQSIDKTEYPHWSDEKLIQHFNMHKEDFERAASLALDESISFSIYEDRNVFEKNKNMDTSKVSIYKSYLDKLKLFCIGSSKKYKNVVFISTTEGWVANSSEKGYLFTNDDGHVETTYKSLDGLTHSINGTAYRHIEGNWYLYISGY